MNAIDTNILVYAVDSSEPNKSSIALGLLHRLATSLEPLIVPWQVAAEFLTCLRRWEDSKRISRQDTQDYLEQFITPLPVVYPSVKSLPIALELGDRYSLSHWDSMLLAACIESGIGTLYSEDFTNGATYDSVTVLNPFNLPTQE